MRQVGRVESPATEELSGLVASRTQRGVLWTHNDSGDAPRLFALRADGELLGSYSVTGAQAVDWEDIATAPAPGGRGADLYVGDIGDNLEIRRTVVVYRFSEPDVGTRGGVTAPAGRFTLRYPDGPHDAESLLVDPLRRDLTIVTKSVAGDTRVYWAPARLLRRQEPFTLRPGGRIRLGKPVTAGDVSPDGRTIALRTYGRLAVWSRRSGERVDRALRQPPCVSPTILREPNGEALALQRGGSTALTVTEGSRPAIRRYVPQPPP